MVEIDELKRIRWMEMGSTGAGIASMVLAFAGAIIVVLKEDWRHIGVLAIALSVVLQLVMLALTYNIRTFRFLGKETRGSDRVEFLARWTRVKVSSVLHNMLGLFGIVVVLMGVLGRFGLVDITLTGYQADRALSLFLAVFAINTYYAFHQSVRVELDPDRAPGTRILYWTSLNIAFLIAAFAIYINLSSTALALGGAELKGTDAPVLLVGAFTISALMLSIGRGLPSFFQIVSDPRMANRGGYASRTKSVLMPTMVAFTLLTVFILVIVVFGAGIFSVLDTVGSSKSVIAVLGIMVLAVIVGIGISFFLARQEDKVELFKREVSKDRQIVITIVSISGFLAACLLIMAMMINVQGSVGSFSGESWIDFASLAMLVALGPYGFYAARKQRHVDAMELRFPDFLRDLASSHKGGLTLVQSVQVAARGEYGGLSHEIQRLADQLSWNVSFDEAFSRFAERVSTPLVARSVNLVLEAGRSGGSTTDVLLAAARDAREIKTLERERKLNMSVYTTVIYVTFMVFLFVISVLVGQFLPEIIRAGEASADSELDLGDSGLNLGGVGESDYRQFYFIAGSVQAIGNGMLAGIMGSGSPTLGLRHAFIMVLITYITFGFLL